MQSREERKGREACEIKWKQRDTQKQSEGRKTLHQQGAVDNLDFFDYLYYLFHRSLKPSEPLMN